MAGFFEILTAAVNDIIEHGYDSQARLDRWILQLKQAATRQIGSTEKLNDNIRQALARVYDGVISPRELLRIHPGVSRFTVEQLSPKLRAELNSRIAASSNLIRLNRQQTMAKMEQRFSGWATSIPNGGSETVDKRGIKQDIYKPLQRLPFEERRVNIDQGAKLVSAISQTIALNGGAIAMRWHSRWRQPGYNFREDHKERDGLIYLVPDNWASKAGYVKSVNGYIDDITRPAEEPFCKCSGHWIYTLRGMPEEMLTERGKKKLEEVRRG